MFKIRIPTFDKRNVASVVKDINYLQDNELGNVSDDGYYYQFNSFYSAYLMLVYLVNNTTKNITILKE